MDAYAGTGALGIEAISRGARDVTFVEQDRRAQALIAENLAHCGISTGYTIIRRGAHRAFRSLVGRPGPDGLFDIILLDPPYDIERDDLGRVLEAAGDIAGGGRGGRARACPANTQRPTQPDDYAGAAMCGRATVN